MCNDSGFVFRVNNLVPHLPSDLRPILRDASGLHLYWNGRFGRGYLVQRTLSLDPPAWVTIGAAGGNVPGAPTNFIDPLAADRHRAFYRLAPSL